MTECSLLRHAGTLFFSFQLIHQQNTRHEVGIVQRLVLGVALAAFLLMTGFPEVGTV